MTPYGHILNWLSYRAVARFALEMNNEHSIYGVPKAWPGASHDEALLRCHDISCHWTGLKPFAVSLRLDILQLQ